MDYPKNFSRKELLWSSKGNQLGIANEPDSDEIEQNILKTALFLQQLRDALSKRIGKEMPITVLSCYRSKAVNNAVGGSKKSAHMQGLAADIRVDGLTPVQLANFIKECFQFDQLILEFNQWVHVGIETPSHSRQQLLTAVKRSGKTVYLNGLVTN